MKRFFAIAACVAALGLTALATAQEHGETPHDTAPGHAEPPPDEGHHKKKDLNVADIFDKERPALVALLINFGLLVGLYYTLGRKPIAEALKQRKTTIGKDIEEAQKMLDEALERAKKYQGDLKNVDTDAAMAKSTLIATGKGEVERMLEDANEKSERMKRDAERLVEQERKQVHEDLVRETVELAVAEAMKVLERSVTADDHQRLAQDLLGELSRRPGVRGASMTPPRAGEPS